jgi:hypothetical protein
VAKARDAARRGPGAAVAKRNECDTDLRRVPLRSESDRIAPSQRHDAIGREETPPPRTLAGKWNTFEITADKRHLTITLNGTKTADVRNGLNEEGHITLQYGTGVIKFRKVAVKPL